LKTQPPVGKVMCTVFGIGKAWSSWISWNPNKPPTLTKPKARISRIRPEKKTTFLLQHDNAKHHTSLKIMRHVAKFSWTVLPYPPYSPDLVTSVFHLFGLVKDGLCSNIFLTVTPSSQLWESRSPLLVQIFMSAACRLLLISGKNA
jgi:hypothetical protein